MAIFAQNAEKTAFFHSFKHSNNTICVLCNQYKTRKVFQKSIIFSATDASAAIDSALFVRNVKHILLKVRPYMRESIERARENLQISCNFCARVIYYISLKTY